MAAHEFRTSPSEPREMEKRARPGPGDDFYCLRFEVWYSSFDCAIRTHFQTSPSCLGCHQGRFNLKRHAPSLRGLRFPSFSVEPD
jgi:hypothetical protein